MIMSKGQDQEAKDVVLHIRILKLSTVCQYRSSLKRFERVEPH